MHVLLGVLVLNVLAAALMWSSLTSSGTRGGAAYLSLLLSCSVVGASRTPISPLRRGSVATFTPRPPRTVGEAPIGFIGEINGQKIRIVQKDGDVVTVSRVTDEES